MVAGQDTQFTTLNPLQYEEGRSVCTPVFTVVHLTVQRDTGATHCGGLAQDDRSPGQGSGYHS